jgi:pimeloyl-ACP methyl ester carboxylesterase
MTTGQFANRELTKAVKLIAIDLLGHGRTRTKSENYTYWDMAIMNIQLMEALGIEKYFVLGTSQGGWIAARMALLAPNNVYSSLDHHVVLLNKVQIQGIIILGSSMDWGSPRTVELGCWNVSHIGDALISAWTSKDATPDFELDDGFCNMNVDLGMGKKCDKKTRDFWVKTIKENYLHDDGRRRARMVAINLRDRDGLHGRLFDIRCPVLWMHVSCRLPFLVSILLKLFT